MCKLNTQQIENLAIEIRNFLIEQKLWIDCNIYFNGKCFTTYDGKVFANNDCKNLIVLEDRNPKDYFSYVAEDHILSMSFEGPFYSALNYRGRGHIIKDFNELLSKYGVYYEQGESWNLTCFEI